MPSCVVRHNYATLEGQGFVNELGVVGMKSILIATDLSARSDRAVERAAQLASEHRADLTIVHVVDEDLPASIADAQEAAARQAIEEHVKTLATDDPPPISIEVVFGRADADILEMSEKTQADMIVLGMHRKDSLLDMFRGTTAERVIRASAVPVLMVRERAGQPYNRVMVGVDFSVYARRAVEFAARLVPDGEFHLVHAYDVPFSGFIHGQDSRREISKRVAAQFQDMIEQEMAAFLSTVERKAIKLNQIMQQGTVHEVLHQQVKKLSPDLLVVGTHGKTGVARAVLGSMSEDLLRDPPCDVLAVNAW